MEVFADQMKSHVKYFTRCLKMLPSSASSLDPNRMTLLFFSLSGLDLLGALPADPDARSHIIDWIYSLQVLPHGTDQSIPAGFRPGPELGMPFNPAGHEAHLPGDNSHITMTYTAIACLLILGDDLARANRVAIAQDLQKFQQPNGSFNSLAQDGESDLRFVYCACCVAAMLNDWRGINMPALQTFILSCITYEGAFAQACGVHVCGSQPYYVVSIHSPCNTQGPGLEAHAGCTFCAVAALALMGKLSALSSSQHDRLVQWLLFRQEKGFQGRPGKQEDTCYTFWVGASLQLLGAAQYINQPLLLSFMATTQNCAIGGFGKHADCSPDPMHSYLGLAGLSVAGLPSLQPLHAALNISTRAAASVLLA